MSEKTKKLNLEETVQYLVDTVESGIKPEKWLLFSELAQYITEENVGKYYLVFKDTDNKDHLYYITKRNNDGLIADDLGLWPRQGPQGVPGEEGPAPTITINSNGNWVVDGVDTGKKSYGKQGEKGDQGITGRPGAGVGTVTDVDGSEYLLTIDTSGQYEDYTTSVDIKYYDGATQETDTATFKYRTKKSLSVGNPTGSGALSLNRKENTTVGTNSVATGTSCEASGTHSSATGNNTIASGNSAHAEGYNSIAAGSYSHAEGRSTNCSGDDAHTEGYMTQVSVAHGHAEGNQTTVSGADAHAEGYKSTASAPHAHAEGNLTIASGNNSHAEGFNTEANHRSQHVFGEYNELDNSTEASTAKGNYVEIVGKGTSTARSNARTLDWAGNEYLAGNLQCNGLTNGTTTRTLTDLLGIRKLYKHSCKFTISTIGTAYINFFSTSGTSLTGTSPEDFSTYLKNSISPKLYMPRSSSNNTEQICEILTISYNTVNWSTLHICKEQSGLYNFTTISINSNVISDTVSQA